MKKIRALKRNSIHFKIDDIIRDLKTLGIHKNDIILVHSSLSRIGYVENGAKTVIDALINVLGKDGTLIMPTYYMLGTMYKTCLNKNYIFDLQKSPTILGAIPSEFLKLKGIARSIHPTHSVSAIGKHSEFIIKDHHLGSTFNDSSPWGKIKKLNGKFLGIGISMGPFTSYHHLEDIMQDNFPLKVKLEKTFDLPCRISQDRIIKVKVNPHNPEISQTRIDKEDSQFIRDYFWEIFEKNKILHVGKIGNAQSWWINANEFYNLLKKLTDLGITIYSIKDELVKKGLYPFELIRSNLEKNVNN